MIVTTAIGNIFGGNERIGGYEESVPNAELVAETSEREA